MRLRNVGLTSHAWVVFPVRRKDLHPTRQSGQRGEIPAIQESAPRCSIGRLRYRDRVQGLLAIAALPLKPVSCVHSTRGTARLKGI